MKRFTRPQFTILVLSLTLVFAAAVYAAPGWPASPTVVDSEGLSGRYPSMTIVDGHPAISYWYFNSTSDRGLRYVRADDADGTSWGTPVDVYTTGNPHIAYTELRVVDGNPAIAYYDGNAEELRYVRATNSTGSGWGTPVSVVNLDNQGGYLSMEIVNGRPAVSYYQDFDLGGGVWYVRANDAQGTSWGTPTQIDSDGYIAQTDLLVVNGRPAVAYRNTGGQMDYIRANDADGSSWPAASTVINVGPQHGSYVSLAIVNGHPAVSYYGGSSNLTYTRATDADGNSWGTHQVLDFSAGLGTSLLDVGGRAAIAYYDSGAVYYILSADSNGDSWTATQVIGDSSGVNREPPLVMVNNRPAVAFYDNVADDLMFTRALSPTAVTMQSTTADSASVPWLLVAVTGLLLLLTVPAGAGLRRRASNY